MSQEIKSFDDLYRDAEAHDDYWVAGVVHDLTEEICERMEQEGISRAELARRLGTSPAYVTKILRGNANFTLASMVKLARALDAELAVGLVVSDNARHRKADAQAVSVAGDSRNAEARG